MIDKAIQNLARKNSDNIEIKISNKNFRNRTTRNR